MARIPRSLIVFPNHAVHKVWRGHNREPNLCSDLEKENYLKFLNDDIENERFEVGSEIQALTLMSNHAHEVFLIKQPSLFSGHMRRHHARYGAYFNRLKKRCGKVAQDRPHTTLIADSNHEIETVCYVHANPVRAKMVKDARNYPWSTHGLYAFGKRKPWMKNIKLPKWYLDLGRTMELRQSAYRKIFLRYLEEKGLVPQTFLKQNFHGPIIWRREKEKAISTWRKITSTPDG